ncbi:MAG: hypothetical protein M1812_008292 [Candelaria pacifica]|nr:MAG: hypothetical protein M1812_008292 [Candelaria pacifica]
MATSGPLSGIDPSFATSLYQQCSDHEQACRLHYLTERFSEPFFRLFLTDSREVQGALNEFFTKGDKAPYARQLRIPKSQVQPGLVVTAWIQLAVNMSQEMRIPPTMRPFDVLSHFALGSLSYENGMPAFGYPALKLSLTSGQVVHTDAELSQVYSGRG